MAENLKALVVVLAVASFVFALAKPICLQFTDPADFARRRAVWLILTVTAFVSPSFWLYVLFAVPLTLWAGKRDKNPCALYLLLLLVIPPMDIRIPTVGINALFDLTHARLLTLTILFAAVASRFGISKGPQRQFTGVDALILSYGVLQLLLLIPYETSTNTLRRGFLFLIDTYLVYFAFSRLSDSRGLTADSMSTLTLAAVLLAPLAVFESHKQWLLYTGMADGWNATNAHAWLFRSDMLRAQVSAGHSISLGLVLAMAVGCWMYLKRSTSRPQVIAVFALLLAGLFYSYSRGPWITAFVAFITFIVLTSNGTAKVLKSLMVVTVITGAILLSPFGAGVADKLPFIGTVAQDTVAYRQQIAAKSWQLIQDNPLWGNPFVLLEMEELRQGQGIIDLVNGFATVALFYGLIALTLFAGAFIAALLMGIRKLKKSKASMDFSEVAIGASLIACTVGTLVHIGTAGTSWYQYAFLGFLVSYARSGAMHPVPDVQWQEASGKPHAA